MKKEQFDLWNAEMQTTDAWFSLFDDQRSKSSLHPRFFQGEIKNKRNISKINENLRKQELN